MNREDDQLSHALMACIQHEGTLGNLINNLAFDQFRTQHLEDNPDYALTDLPDLLKRLREDAAYLANRAAIDGDATALRQIADILDGCHPRKLKPALTPSQRNVVLVLKRFREENGRMPNSHKELVEFSKDVGEVNGWTLTPISKSTLSDFPVPLPIGRGTPGRQPKN